MFTSKEVVEDNGFRKEEKWRVYKDHRNERWVGGGISMYDGSAGPSAQSQETQPLLLSAC